MKIGIISDIHGNVKALNTALKDLGCPGKTEFAPYGILTINKEKQEYEQKYAEYNVQEVIEDIKQIKVPGYEGVLILFYGGRN